MLSNSGIYNCFLNCNLFTESLQWVFSLKLLKLNWSVLIQEFVDWKESSTYSDLDAILLHFYHNSLSSKLIDTLCLSHEHNLEFLSLWIVIDELSKSLVDLVISNWNVNSDSLLQVNNILLQSFNLDFRIFQLLQKF